MLDPITLLIYVLAAYRLTRLIIQDEITEPLRERIWKRFPPHTKAGYLITCPWCVSVYVATLLTLSYILIPSVMFTIALILALSAAAGILSKFIDG